MILLKMDELLDLIKDEFSLEAQFYFLISFPKATLHFLKEIQDMLNKDYTSQWPPKLEEALTLESWMHYVIDYIIQEWGYMVEAQEATQGLEIQRLGPNALKENSFF